MGAQSEGKVSPPPWALPARPVQSQGKRGMLPDVSSRPSPAKHQKSANTWSLLRCFLRTVTALPRTLPSPRLNLAPRLWPLPVPAGFQAHLGSGVSELTAWAPSPLKEMAGVGKMYCMKGDKLPRYKLSMGNLTQEAWLRVYTARVLGGEQARC